MPKRKSPPHNGRLDNRQQRFVDVYVTNGFRERKAAIEAGYAEKSAHVTASRLLKNAKIQAAISARMEQLVMSKQETMYRLSEHGRGDLAQFIGLSSEEIKNHPKSWLIKKFKRDATIHELLPGGIMEETIELEMLPPQSALTTIAKHHGLLKDDVTININIELVTQLYTVLKEIGADPEQTLRELMEAGLARKRVSTDSAG